VITLVMLAVGSGLFAWYQIKGMTAAEAALFAESSTPSASRR
jgi:hypothetical protein